MITRRDAILAGLCFPVWGVSATKKFWNEKKPADWSKSEIDQILTKSPWAREAEVVYNAGPGSLGRAVGGGTAGGYGGSRRYGSRGGRAGASGNGTPNVSPGKFKAIVRWESALPIRETMCDNLTDDPLANYIISVTGDLPMLGTHRDEEEAENDQRAEMFKQYTKLDRKGDPVYLATVKFQSADSTWFYFQRTDPIHLDDKQVTFVTKLGPIDVKAKFPLKEMLYQGKLAL
jgi:hypothetical protein